MIPNIPLAAILVGTPIPFGPRGGLSSIGTRQPITGPVRLLSEGLEGDRVGDRRWHGGPDKALHLYPAPYYAEWLAERPALAEKLSRPGAFGENLTGEGICDEDICLGDRYRLGTALVEVSHGRDPCWKQERHLEQAGLVNRSLEVLRMGFYLRVLEEGVVQPGDQMIAVERVLPDWPLPRLAKALHWPGDQRADLQAMLTLDLLAEAWKHDAATRLETEAKMAEVQPVA